MDHRPRRSSFSVAAVAGAAAVPARATRAAAMRASRHGLLGLGRRRKSDREAPPEGKARGRKTPPNGEVALPGRRRRDSGGRRGSSGSGGEKPECGRKKKIEARGKRRKKRGRPGIEPRALRVTRGGRRGEGRSR